MTQEIIQSYNQEHQQQHLSEFSASAELLDKKGYDVHNIISRLQMLQVAVPSWALGTGGTRFGRFSGGGEPRNLLEKIEDVGLIRKLSGSTDAVSLHIPWDIPEDSDAIHQALQEQELRIDSVNSNTFQDSPGQKYSYKYGSLSHSDEAVRQQAVEHNLAVVEYGKQLHSSVLTVWLADGSNFPGQMNFQKAYQRTEKSLQQISMALPPNWTMLIEYKPFEPNFYSMVIPDWGTSKALCDAAGKNAKVLVDLGHHLPNTNIEQIVARLLHFNALGGFHFNGSMYGDDDLTTGAIKPYQLFLIFNELVDHSKDQPSKAPSIAYMIDASHNTKDPLEDILQSLQNILIAYAKSLLIKRSALNESQEINDPVLAEETLQNAFQTDVRPLLAEARRQAGFAIDPVQCFRQLKVREKRISKRGFGNQATGL
jgi:L-rhamnose isomerase / sugar isomerase